MSLVPIGSEEGRFSVWATQEAYDWIRELEDRRDRLGVEAWQHLSESVPGEGPNRFLHLLRRIDATFWRFRYSEAGSTPDLSVVCFLEGTATIVCVHACHTGPGGPLEADMEIARSAYGQIKLSTNWGHYEH